MWQRHRLRELYHVFRKLGEGSSITLSVHCDSYSTVQPHFCEAEGMSTWRLTWLRKCYTGWYTVVPARSSPGGLECCGSTRVPVQSIRPHHTAASASSLAAYARTNIIQTGRTSLPVSPWTCAGLPGWRFTACHRTTWSTTPALVVDFGTGCTSDTALQDRRPSVPCRYSKNLEQSADRSDVFGLPANI